jgi:hypothetical protein
MRILLTNTSLAHRTGSELYTVEMARALAARGQDPVVYSPLLGELARELAAAGIAVVDDLAALDEPPDLVHGHHHAPTLTALLHFPAAPGLFVCHGFEPWEEAPPLFPRLRRYVAVDLPCAERIAAAGIAAEKIEILPNFVDLARFRPRPALPQRPGRALVFSNNASPATHLAAVRTACAAAGIEVDVAGIASGRVAERPEELLPSYDLVFAKGRAALEALAVGAAVVLCDAAGCGPLVRTADLPRLRRLNFGFRTLDRPLEPSVLRAEIARYDRRDAARAAREIRRTAGLDLAVARYLEIYESVLAEVRAEVRTAGAAETAGGAAAGPLAESRAAAAYLRWLDPYLKERSRALIDRDELWRRLHALEAERDRLRARLGDAPADPPLGNRG